MIKKQNKRTIGGTATTFAYYASGQRVMTVEPAGKTTYFPFPGYSEEMVGTSVTARRVTYTIVGTAVASRVQVVGGSNTLYYLYTDHLGSTVAQSNTSGTIALTPGSRTYYLPYGSYRGTPPTQTLTDRDFTGQRENRELGLLYYQARFYVPSIGRFASADTLVPDPANPQQFNRYTYSLNSPLNYSDPTGHCAEKGDDACWSQYDQIYAFIHNDPAKFLGKDSVWSKQEYWNDLGTRSTQDLKGILHLLKNPTTYAPMSSGSTTRPPVSVTDVLGFADSLLDANNLFDEFYGKAIVTSLPGDWLIPGAAQLIDDSNGNYTPLERAARAGTVTIEGAATDYVSIAFAVPVFEAGFYASLPAAPWCPVCPAIPPAVGLISAAGWYLTVQWGGGYSSDIVNETYVFPILGDTVGR